MSSGEHHLADSWKRMVRAPSRAFVGLLELRAGKEALPPFRTPPAALPEAVVQIPMGGATHWRFTHRILHPKAPPEQLRFSGSAYDLPIRDGYSARDHLTARVFRTYLATWALADDYSRRNGSENQHGLFQWERARVILDYYGCKPRIMRNSGRTSRRAPEALVKALDEDLAFLAGSVIVDGNGDVRVERGEPLIHCYGASWLEGQAPTAVEDADMCAHARIAWGTRATNFFQVPRAVMSLRGGHVDSLPALLGISHGLRQRFATWKQEGRLSLTAGELLRLACVDVGSDRRKWGRAAACAKRLELLRPAVEAGQLGRLVVPATDVNEATPVTLEPSYTLLDAYSTLDDRQRAAAARAARAMPERTVRAPGRPSTRMPTPERPPALPPPRQVERHAPVVARKASEPTPIGDAFEAFNVNLEGATAALDALEGRPVKTIDPAPPREVVRERPRDPAAPLAPDPDILAELERALEGKPHLADVIARSTTRSR